MFKALTLREVLSPLLDVLDIAGQPAGSDSVTAALLDWMDIELIATKTVCF